MQWGNTAKSGIIRRPYFCAPALDLPASTVHTSAIDLFGASWTAKLIQSTTQAGTLTVLNPRRLSRNTTPYADSGSEAKTCKMRLGETIA